MTKDEANKLFGFKLGQKVHGRALNGSPVIEGQIVSFVIPASGEPFVVLSDEKVTDRRYRRSHHRTLADIWA